MVTDTLNQSILRQKDGRADTAEKLGGRKGKGRGEEYFEDLRRVSVIVSLIKIKGRNKGRKSDWSNSFDRMTGPLLVKEHRKKVLKIS